MINQNKMMKCNVYYGPEDMRTEFRKIPVPAENEVLIKVMACGVCGSDVHIYHGDQGSTSTIPPLIQGHEFSGIVEAVGSDVKEYSVGDRVCVDPADNCNDCRYCKNGLMSHCENMNAIGTNVDGGFSQYCRVPARLLYKLSDDVSFEEGAMAEPLACCIHGIDQSDIKTGDNVLVYGGGPIGLLFTQLAKINGASNVIVVEPVEMKRDLAKKLGADLVIDPNKEEIWCVLQENHIHYVQVIIETCGLKNTLEEAIEIVDNHGTILFFAVTNLDHIIELKTYKIFQKEISLRGSFCSPYTIGRAVEMINSRSIDVSAMIAGTESLENLSKILTNSKIRENGKYIILPQE